MSSPPSSPAVPRGQHPLSTDRRPNLPRAPAEGGRRLSKQELVRQQIARETFPNELEGLVPSPGAAALPACLARQRLALAGGQPALRGEQRSGAGAGAGGVSSCPSVPLRRRGPVVKKGMLALPGELAAWRAPWPWGGMLPGERRPACEGRSRLVAELGSAPLCSLNVYFVSASVAAWSG